jgi:phospholipase C
MGALDKIEHVVVLMLENRSFDSMLGQLYPKSDRYDGLDGTEHNLDRDGRPIAVWSRPSADPRDMTIPAPDPGELWTDINAQLFGAAAPSPEHAPTMSGFVGNYQAQAALAHGGVE